MVDIFLSVYICINKKQNTMKKFDELYLYKGYALETLINGNINESIRYINEFISNGYFTPAHDELILIKDNYPEKYNYIKQKIKFHFTQL